LKRIGRGEDVEKCLFTQQRVVIWSRETQIEENREGER